MRLLDWLKHGETSGFWNPMGQKDCWGVGDARLQASNGDVDLMKRIHKWSFKYRKRPFGEMQIYHQLHALKLLGFTNKTVVKPNKMGILSASARARDSNANQHQTKSKLESTPYDKFDQRLFLDTYGC